MRTFSALILSLLTVPAFAQDGGVEMADAMMESGKIYIVIGVLVIIFVGIVAYLTALDKRIRKMEKEMEGNSKSET